MFTQVITQDDFIAYLVGVKPSNNIKMKFSSL